MSDDNINSVWLTGAPPSREIIAWLQEEIKAAVISYVTDGMLVISPSESGGYIRFYPAEPLGGFGDPEKISYSESLRDILLELIDSIRYDFEKSGKLEPGGALAPQDLLIPGAARATHDLLIQAAAQLREIIGDR